MNRLVSVVAFGLSVLALVPTGALAAWENNGGSVCSAANAQSSVAITTDGNGGAVIAWVDMRNDQNGDIYVQRVDVKGNALWGADGLAVAVGADAASSVTIAYHPGEQMVYVAWADSRSNKHIYIQCLDKNGNRKFAANGQELCPGNNAEQSVPRLWAGKNAFVTFTDVRNGNQDIYGQSIDVNGNVTWIQGGEPLETAAGTQEDVAVATTSSGEFLMAWTDRRSGIDADIVACWYKANGKNAWQADAPICTANGDQLRPAVTALRVLTGRLNPPARDDVVITWEDQRGQNADIYGERVQRDGNPRTLWSNQNGLLLCNANGDQRRVRVVSRFTEELFMVWEDERGNNPDIFGVMVTAAGVASVQNGFAVCDANGKQSDIRLIATGRYFASWLDERDGSKDIYAQSYVKDGSRAWANNGVPICKEPAPQQGHETVFALHTVAGVNTWSAIVAWEDSRNNGTKPDIYATRACVLRAGKDGEVDLKPTVDGEKGTSMAPPPVPMPSFSVRSIHPNPFNGSTEITLTLPRAADVVVEIVDVSGRRVRHQRLERVVAGEFSWQFNGNDDAGRRLPAGVYFCRVTVGPHATARKLVVVR
jgi:hypothetical protein